MIGLRKGMITEEEGFFLREKVSKIGVGEQTKVRVT